MRVVSVFMLSVLLAFSFSLFGGDAKDALNDPAKVDADFAVQGEYLGDAAIEDGKAKTGVQVIARGDGNFHAVFYPGGLPGDGWAKGQTKIEADGKTENGVTSFSVPKLNAKIQGDTLKLTDPAGKALGELKHIVRQSPTLGAPLPPTPDAVMLFDGTNTDQFEKGRMTEDKLLKEGTTSKLKFQDATFHIEFRLPYMPKASGQGRGNSGCYFQGRYEVQVLDSFGLAGLENEAGGIYSVGPPLVNMCFPPLSWQTYDVEFTAARYENGKKVKNARLLVKHNGVVVQNNIEADHATTACTWQEGPEPGPLYLQDHGNPVRYRNIWVLVKK
jgi:hypothetical protein